jgi:hypothetical protein
VKAMVLVTFRRHDQSVTKLNFQTLQETLQ